MRSIKQAQLRTTLDYLKAKLTLEPQLGDLEPLRKSFQQRPVRTVCGRSANGNLDRRRPQRLLVVVHDWSQLVMHGSEKSVHDQNVLSKDRGKTKRRVIGASAT